MDFLYSQLVTRLPYPTGSCAGKTVIVTGSNVGLGKEAARHFARLGASHLILAVRSLERGHAAKEDIETTAKSSETKIEVWQVDMGSYASVKNFAARLNDELDRIDIFVANAGIARDTWEILEDNESTITVNVVSTFLLTALVLPKLKATAKKYQTRPTLTVTASSAHSFANFPQRTAPEGQIFNTINDEALKEKNFSEQYPLSKMLEIFAVRSIGEKHPASSLPVTINCVDPGLCKSELSREHPTWSMYFMKLLLARSTESGSRTLFHAATQGGETHGKYLSDCHLREPTSLVTNTEGKFVQDRLWIELSAKLEKIKPGVMSNFS